MEGIVHLSDLMLRGYTEGKSSPPCIRFLMAQTHCTGPGPGAGQGTRQEQCVSVLCYVLYTLHMDRNRNMEPLFPILLVPFPVPVPVPFPVPCSVYESLLSVIYNG